MFRGQSDSNWEIKPKIGRDEYRNKTTGFSYVNFINRWIYSASNYIDLPESDWGKLAIAQRYGLATHFLDWTTNPFIALFFAVKDLPQKNASLIAIDKYDMPFFPSIDVTIRESFDKFRLPINKDDVIDVWLCNLKPTIPRIVNQDSILTLHIFPERDISECRIDKYGVKPQISKLEIEYSNKSRILEELYQFGVSYKSVFPDLEGITQQINSDIIMCKNRF
jgi:hypothetical protein